MLYLQTQPLQTCITLLILHLWNFLLSIYVYVYFFSCPISYMRLWDPWRESLCLIPPVALTCLSLHHVWSRCLIYSHGLTEWIMMANEVHVCIKILPMLVLFWIFSVADLKLTGRQQTERKHLHWLKITKEKLDYTWLPCKLTWKEILEKWTKAINRKCIDWQS